MVTAEFIYVALHPSDFSTKPPNTPFSFKSKTTKTKVQQLRFQ